MRQFDLVDPRTLWKSYLLAIAMLFVLITFSHFGSFFFGGDSVRATQDINMSGRQRMLSQRIMFFATLSQKNGYLEAESAEKLQAALDLFLESHEALVSETERKLPKSVHDIYFSPEGPMLDAKVKEFTDATQVMLTGSVRGRLIAYMYMRENGPDTLLAALDTAVSTFEEEARKDAHRGELWGYWGYGLALLGLLLEAILIFRPAHKAIVKAVDAFEENNEQLKQQEAEAFAALEDAEDAWVEAAHASKISETQLENTKEHASQLRKEINIFMTAMHGFIAQTVGPNLTDAQRSSLSHLKRLTSTSHDIVREFTDSYAHGEQETQEKAVIVPLHEAAESALAAIRHQFMATEIWVEASRDMSAEPKILGQPSQILRIIIGTVLFALHETGANRAQIDLKVTTDSDDPRTELSIFVFGTVPKMASGDEKSLPIFEHGLRALTQSVCQKTDFQTNVGRPDDDKLEFRLSWAVSLSTSKLKPRKSVRQARRYPAAK